MTTGRCTIPRLTLGTQSSAAAKKNTAPPDAPSLMAIRLVFGVGTSPQTPPNADTFKPVYTLSIPVFSLGGLDSDGVYEFDAPALLEQLQRRSQRRRWAMRLELEFAQNTQALLDTDVYVETPFANEALDFSLCDPQQQGTMITGGGRCLLFASSLLHEGAHVSALNGLYSIQLSENDPREQQASSCRQSPRREIKLDLSQYEFEG